MWLQVDTRVGGKGSGMGFPPKEGKQKEKATFAGESLLVTNRILMSELLGYSLSLSLFHFFPSLKEDKGRDNWEEFEFTVEITSEAGYGRGHHRNRSPCNHGDELRKEGVGREGANCQCRERAGGSTGRGGETQVKRVTDRSCESFRLNSGFLKEEN